MKINVDFKIDKKNKFAETIILNCPWNYYGSAKAYEYAHKVLGKRWLQGEGIILKCPHYSYLYAKNVLKNRWPVAENSILESSHTGYKYAKYILKSRWEKFENSFEKSKSSHHDFSVFYLYSKYLLKNRWVAVEKNVEKHFVDKDMQFYHQDIIKYIINIKKSRWIKLEPAIAKSAHIKDYTKVLSSEELSDFERILAFQSLDEPKHQWQTNYAKKYFQDKVKAS